MCFYGWKIFIKVFENVCVFESKYIIIIMTNKGGLDKSCREIFMNNFK